MCNVSGVGVCQAGDGIRKRKRSPPVLIKAGLIPDASGYVGKFTWVGKLDGVKFE